MPAGVFSSPEGTGCHRHLVQDMGLDALGEKGPRSHHKCEPLRVGKGLGHQELITGPLEAPSPVRSKPPFSRPFPQTALEVRESQESKQQRIQVWKMCCDWEATCWEKTNPLCKVYPKRPWLQNLWWCGETDERLMPRSRLIFCGMVPRNTAPAFW